MCLAILLSMLKNWSQHLQRFMSDYYIYNTLFVNGLLKAKATQYTLHSTHTINKNQRQTEEYIREQRRKKQRKEA